VLLEELMKRTSSTEGNGKETGRKEKTESELENEPETATSDDDEAEVDSDDDEAVIASLGPESWDNPETRPTIRVQVLWKTDNGRKR